MAKITNYDYCYHNHLDIIDISCLMATNGNKKHKTLDEFLKDKCFYQPKFKMGDIIAYKGIRREHDLITINERCENSERVIPENVYVICEYDESFFDYVLREIDGLCNLNWAALIEFDKVNPSAVLLGGDKVKSPLIDFRYAKIGHVDI